MTLTNKILLACTVVILLAAAAITAVLVVFPIRHAEIIERHAQINNLDPAFIAAVIHAESKFRPDAVSRADARGLMQITPPTGEWLAEHLRLQGFTNEQLFDIETNIKLGSFYLRRLLDQHNQDVRVALAAYNAGTGRVRGWLQDPQFSQDGVTLSYIPFGETRTYIERVLFNQRIYAILYTLRDIFPRG
ncbi:MAG: lytic transglycosylase domain-containing protein [Defluviitaleaceae bacterium]|nr:lytic transglycosylase domain-containing protein [Defluviitaleaceae bacterium]